MWGLYKRHPAFVLGFHGCDRQIGEDVLAGTRVLTTSQNDYDWLGPGTYFWEGNPERALQFAVDAANEDARATGAGSRILSSSARSSTSGSAATCWTAIRWRN